MNKGKNDLLKLDFLKLYKTREYTGITLIALVITIIVLLILAGVSINLVIGENGILKQAQGAVQKNDKATLQEKLEMCVATIDSLYYKNLYINKNKEVYYETLNAFLDNGQFSDEKYNIHEYNYNLENRKVSFKLNISNEEKYLVDINIDTGKVKVKDYRLVENVNIGDYVDYKSGNDYHYISYASLTNPGNLNNSCNGYKDLTFSSDNSIKWRVIEKDENIGMVKLISSQTVYSDSGEGLYINGQEGLKNGSKEIYNICEIFSHGIGAKSYSTVNWELLDKYLDIDEQAYYQSFWNTTYTFDSKNSYKDGNLIQENLNLNWPDNLRPTDENNLTITNKFRGNVDIRPFYVGEDSDTIKLLLSMKYWIPEYVILTNGKTVWWNYYVMSETKLLGSSVSNLVKNNCDGDFQSEGIRPIIVLESNLLYNGGNGSETNPIQFK